MLQLHVAKHCFAQEIAPCTSTEPLNPRMLHLTWARFFKKIVRFNTLVELTMC